MIDLAPHERARRQIRFIMRLSAVLSGCIIFTLLDRWLWRVTLVGDEAWLHSKDWYQVLRQMGYLPTWAIIAACLVLHDCRALRQPEATGLARALSPGQKLGAWHRGLMVLFSAGLGGLAAEIMKITVQRERPGDDGLYRFGWLNQDLGIGWGLASSHAGVAFGGAIMLGWFFPAIRVPLMLLALGCGLSRMLAGAHFATDVYAALLLSYAVAAWMWRTFRTFPGGALDRGSLAWDGLGQSLTRMT